MTTVVWSAQDALLTLLTGLPSTEGFAVTMGWPLRLEDRHVWVSGDVEASEQIYAISGLGGKDERVRIRVVVMVTDRTDDYLVPRDAVKVVSDAIEDAIAADPTLTGTCELAEVTAVEVDEAVTSEQPLTRSVVAALTVTVRAWREPGN